MRPSDLILIRPIGVVKRKSVNENVKDRELLAKIVLRKSLSPALDGIEEYSHIFVLFWLHKIPETGKTFLKVHPRGKEQLPLTGIFATRTPRRVNPIGLTLVELLRRKDNMLWVRGLDALDHTPVIDIKPYDGWDVAVDFRIPPWRGELDK
jgi:tRNA-Thr(GGU) m(6)t(6)A37 methyltransferase TsaA